MEDSSDSLPPSSVETWFGSGETGKLLQRIDWSQNDLGPASGWPEALKSALAICLASRFPIAIYWGERLTLLYNDAWSPILGSKHPWGLGRAAREVWPEIWDTIGPMFEQVLSTGEATYAEDSLLLMHRHGYTEECYFNFTFTPVRNASGRVEGVFNAVNETTYRVLDERRTRVQRRLSERLAGPATPSQVYQLAVEVLESAGADVPFCALYGGSEHDTWVRAGVSANLAQRDDALRWLDANASPQSPGPETLTLSADAIAAFPSAHWPESVTRIIRVPLLASRQQHGALLLGVNPRRAVDDKYLQFAEWLAGSVAAAIAAAKALEVERMRAQQLTELDQAKTKFFNNVSHEFRTPLTLLLGPTEDALSRPDGAITGEALRALHRNELRLMKLVNSLLDLARIDAGKVEPRLQASDLVELTRDLTLAFAPSVERAGLRLDFSSTIGVAPALVDHELWERVVFNLLSNALKFTFEGVIEVQLSGAKEGWWTLEVRDTGTGIPAHELPRLFERFHRVEGARSRSHEGTGIGLSLVHELTKLHGGYVEVSSELGTGSTFSVHVPSHIATSPLVSQPRESDGMRPLLQEADGWSRQTPTDPTAPAGMSGSILIVEDNADMRDYLARVLRPFWQVELVGDGLAALASLRTGNVRLVITDVMMPGLDGFGLLKQIRADPALLELPVIMLSARAGDEASLEGIEAGADDYLIKPFAARELLARVRARLDVSLARAQAARARARLHEQLEQAPVPMAILSGRDLTFTLANPAYQAMVGKRDLVGRPLRQAFPELAADAPIIGVLEAVFTTGAGYDADEYEMALARDASGTPKAAYFRFTAQPLRDELGNVEGIMTCAVDVTAQVEAHRALEQQSAAVDSARREAEAANRAKDEFLAMLGHELRNPLAPITTALQLLELKGQSSPQHAVIRRQVTHLTTLVDDLLDVSRITRGKLELRRRTVELATTITRAIEMATPLLDSHSQRLRVHVPDEGLLVHGDPARLAQVFTNLLTNAAKYSPARTTIRIDAERRDQRVVVNVVDQGYGMAPDMVPQIFGLFFQESQPLDRARGGLGLGLAIVRSLVELHGGSVMAESAGLGAGSTFRVELPLAPSADGSSESGTRWEVSRPPTSQASARRVLVVDDNIDAAQTLAEALTAQGYYARVAHDAVSAMKTLEVFTPDACLLDIGLPGIDGYQLAAQIRAQPGLPSHLRLIAVTGYGQASDKERAKNAGFDVHVVKPVPLQGLLELLDAD